MGLCTDRSFIRGSKARLSNLTLPRGMGMNRRTTKLAVILFAMAACGMLIVTPRSCADDGDQFEINKVKANKLLSARLNELGFTGNVESTLERRLGRPLNPRLADLGRMLWFDTITGLNNDNTCAGCHSPTNGFGDSQSI